MGKSFDSIDIILIILISSCLLTILIMTMWIILCKLEQIAIKRKGSSKLTTVPKQKEIKPDIKQKKSPTPSKKKKRKKKKTNVKRKSGYVSPKKRKKKNNKHKKKK